MATTLAQISAQVLEILQKQSTYSGFFTPQKVADAINDSLDFVAAKMQLSDKGWLRQMVLLDSTADQSIIPLPIDTVMVHGVWWKCGSDFVPLRYQPIETTVLSGADSGASSPDTYYLLGNSLFFNPAPTSTETGICQVLVSKYPSVLQAQGDALNAQFDRGLINYAKWRSASVLRSLVENDTSPWKSYEREWLDTILDTIPRKVNSQKFVQDFEI